MEQVDVTWFTRMSKSRSLLHHAEVTTSPDGRWSWVRNTGDPLDEAYSPSDEALVRHPARACVCHPTT